MQGQKKEIVKTALTLLILLVVVSGVFLSLKGDNVLNRVLGQSIAKHQEPPSPTPQTNTIPSERALKVATYVYYTTGGANEEWMNQFRSGPTESQIENFRTVSQQQGYTETQIEEEIKRKQGEETVKQFALYLDNNPSELVRYEVAINKHQQSLQNQYVQQPVQYYAPDNQVNDFQYQIDEQKRKLQWELDEQKRQLQDQAYEQEQQLKKLQREEQNRQLWDTICSGRGQNYNSLAGGGCR